MTESDQIVQEALKVLEEFDLPGSYEFAKNIPTCFPLMDKIEKKINTAQGPGDLRAAIDAYIIVWQRVYKRMAEEYVKDMPLEDIELRYFRHLDWILYVKREGCVVGELHSQSPKSYYSDVPMYTAAELLRLADSKELQKIVGTVKETFPDAFLERIEKNDRIEILDGDIKQCETPVAEIMEVENIGPLHERNTGHNNNDTRKNGSDRVEKRKKTTIPTEYESTQSSLF